MVDLVGGQREPWDVFVRACPETSFCHLWAWRDVLTDVLGHECLNAVALDEDGAWRGVLPLVEVRSPLFGKYLISMPFLNGGGAAGSDEARALLNAWAAKEARQRNVDLLELRTRVPAADGLRQSNRKITVTLDLPPAPETLWRAFPAKLRSQIKRPAGAGYQARFGLGEVDAFYRVFARHMRDLGTPVLPARFFTAVADRFRDVALFGAVYHGEEPVAVGAGFFWDGTFEMTWASSLRTYQADAPNMLLYWKCMTEAIARGATRFDFGRCTTGSGTHRFKRQWGGHDIPLPWAQWSSNGHVAPPAPDSPRYRLATAVWRRLPLAVTNRLGPRLARLLP